MANTTTSPYMSLPVPVAGIDPGPQFALDVNSCMSIIDQHDHTPGHGVLITPGGMNINSDLTFNDNNLTSARAIRFQSQSVPIPPSGLDIGELYEAGVDLYFNDGAGNQIRITQSGGVVGTPGSITGLTPPASASYVSANSTFVFQSAANTPANIDCGFIILRDNVANSPSCTVYPPTMATNQVLTLPLTNTTGQTAIMTMSTADAMGYAVLDNSTIINTSGVISTGPGTAQALVPSGASLPYFGTSAPTGFLMCDGTSYATSAYPALFAAIGYSCGGSGANFNVPDLRGQFLRGVTGSSANDPDASSRTAMNTGGNTGNNVGSVQGFNTSAASLAAGTSITDPGHRHLQGSNVAFDSTALAAYGVGGPTTNYANTTTGTVELQEAFTQTITTGITASTTITGGDETRPINAYCNYIIKT
jgi:microcystin-dependent protein